MSPQNVGNHFISLIIFYTLYCFKIVFAFQDIYLFLGYCPWYEFGTFFINNSLQLIICAIHPNMLMDSSSSLQILNICLKFSVFLENRFPFWVIPLCTYVGYVGLDLLGKELLIIVSAKLFQFYFIRNISTSYYIG